MFVFGSVIWSKPVVAVIGDDIPTLPVLYLLEPVVHLRFVLLLPLVAVTDVANPNGIAIPISIAIDIIVPPTVIVLFSRNPQQHLTNPFVVTVAADKDQRQRVTPSIVWLEVDRHIVSTVLTVDVFTPWQSRVVRYGRRDRVEDIAHLSFQYVPINEILITLLGISTQPTGIP